MAQPALPGLDKTIRDRAFHDWYRFVLAYPPHLVRTYLQDFGLQPGQVVLDPFCGTGTTLIEAKLNGVNSVGLEANPFAQFASSVKTDWDVDPGALVANAQEVAHDALQRLAAQGIDDSRPGTVGSDNGQGDDHLKRLDGATEKLLIKDSISPLPLHKTLVLLDCLAGRRNERYYGHLLLALANALVYSISNLRFGPEVGVDKIKEDVPVIAAWLAAVDRIAGDLRLVAGFARPASAIYLADARQAGEVLAPESVHAVITSPPYPNEKDYTRTTRLESVLLGFINSKAELRTFKQQLVRSNTRVVYKGDDDDRWIEYHVGIRHIADEIEARRIELGKTSGFERLYGRATRLYFGGMARHLAGLRNALCPGAQLAYVVGDQASYLRVMIRTGQLLAEVAQELGYELVRIDLFRTRFATATKEQLREEVVVLQWPGWPEAKR
ncbi:MAG: site-specific DNA-methyltransferase [Anaerolineae bacterium]|nr:site-specific DNA-methyltransferase [Anaerolineae bacterium]